MNKKIMNQVERAKLQTIGVEVEMNNITREKAASLAAKCFGTGRFEYTARRNGYETWSAWDEQIQSIHAPIGLPIGAVTPGEIAVSILAQMIQEKNRISSSSVSSELLESSQSGVLCIITKKNGSAPRGCGKYDAGNRRQSGGHHWWWPYRERCYSRCTKGSFRMYQALSAWHTGGG